MAEGKTIKIDNFALSIHQSCPSKYELRIRQKRTTRYRSPALNIGTAVHAGLAQWYRGFGIDAAILAIEEAWDHSVNPEDYRTLEKAKTVMQQYAKEYPTEGFGVVGVGTEAVMVERTFTLETGMYLPVCADCNHDNQINPDYDCLKDVCTKCGRDLEPIEYGGIVDGIVEFGQQVYVLEHKTTSQLGDYYFEQFKPNNQVSGYVWSVSLLYGQPAAGTIVNAIGIYKVGATRFKRQPTTRNDFEIAEWKKNVLASCIEIKHHERTGYWPQRTQACTMYGACEFLPVHTLNNPESREKRLEQDYVISAWDFENRD